MRDVIEFGGDGPGILLLHGLMGRATTWWPTARWLTAYGRVVGVDARAHGRNPHRTRCGTEQFAEDAADRIRELGIGPAVLIGHSMGGLHAIAVAATYPDLVRAIVVEDMAPDQRGRTADVWLAYFESWPVFESLAHVREFFGPAGDYFVECVEETTDGYRLIGDLAEMVAIAREWGRRDYSDLVAAVRCPMLVIEAGDSPMPAGQQAEMAGRSAGPAWHHRIDGAGHLVHQDAPDEFRGAVEAFLSRVLDR
ncbi:MAG TPA: alpha/beta hydrolase [Pseudonocardiaceae bacterium]|jgi:pimeloyl-ACP methyl ester carboxylesterase|nr:alpha/beta hydrolase [Pseudonocardiaceae bacterium]